MPERVEGDARCRKERDELPLGEELVPVLDDLVRAANEVHVVFLQEARDDVGTERERDAAVVLRPARDVLVRVGPEQVAEETCRRVGERRDAKRRGDVVTHQCRERLSAA